MHINNLLLKTNCAHGSSNGTTTTNFSAGRLFLISVYSFRRQIPWVNLWDVKIIIFTDIPLSQTFIHKQQICLKHTAEGTDPNMQNLLLSPIYFLHEINPMSLEYWSLCSY